MRKTAGALAVLALVAVVGLVVARGRGVPEVAAPLRPEQAGACPEGLRRYLSTAAAYGADSRQSTLGVWRSAGWVSLDARRTVRETLRAAPDGVPEGRIRMDDLAGSQVRAEVESGAEVLAAVETRKSAAAFVASLRRDGSVVFLGDCAFRRATVLLEQHLLYAGMEEEPRSAFRDAVALPRLGEWLFRYEPKWNGLLSGRRLIGFRYGPSPPREAFRDLRRVTVRIDVPEAWRAPGALCVHAGLAWADECAPLAAAPGLRMSITVPAGRHMEVWLVRGYALPIRPIGQIGEFVAAPGGGAGDVQEVRLVANLGVPTYESLRVVATTTHDALRAG